MTWLIIAIERRARRVKINPGIRRAHKACVYVYYKQLIGEQQYGEFTMDSQTLPPNKDAYQSLADLSLTELAFDSRQALAPSGT